MEKAQILASMIITVIISLVIFGMFLFFDYAGLNLFESIVCVYLTIIVFRK